MQSGGGSFTDLRHFIGVVENRNDPEKLGRVQVRVYSIHTNQKDQIPVADLPWAMVLQPNNPATSGIGYSGTGLVEGTWVFGVFLDAKEFQNPLVIGALHGKPAVGPNTNDGFNDPRGKYPQNDPSVHILGESSVSRLARGVTAAETHNVMLSKRSGKEKLGEVKIAKGPEMSTVVSKEVFKEQVKEQQGWKEPHPRFGEPGLENFAESKKNYSTYPFCHVWYTESGHVLEVDDTPGMERLHWYHNKGTFQEINDEGDSITKIVGDNYEIDLQNKNLYIKGDWNITVEGNVREKINGNKFTEIGGNHFITVGKSYVKKVGGSEFKEIITAKSTNVNKNNSLRVGVDKTLTVGGNNTISIVGEQKETVKQAENKTNLSTLNHILANNYSVVGTRIDVGSGKELNLAGNNITFKAVNMMDIDANNMTIDAPTMSIDGPAGNITSNDIVLHTHTHEGSPTAGQGPKTDTGAPK